MSRPARRWLWLIALALLAIGASRLRFDVEILNLLPGQLDVAQGLKTYQRYFSNARELILTVEAPEPETAQTAARELAGLLRQQTNLVAAVTWQPAWMEDPAQSAELLAFLWLNQPPELFAQLAERLSPASRSNTLAETRAQLSTSFSPRDLATLAYDPYGLTRLPESLTKSAPAFGSGDELFASGDGKFRLMFVEAKPDLTSYPACRAWLAAVRQVVQEAQRTGKIPGNAQLHYTGRPVFVAEIAGGMENDTAGSIVSTLATIGVLFWLTHRRIRPLLWLLLLLLAILGAATALGGLVFGRLNVVSLGFASILLGLAEDFGIVIYQESRSHPELNESQLRREVAPGIFWSAVTTAGAFLTLNLSTLPGLGQLGTLVALGIIVAAVVMLYAYLPLSLRFRRPSDSTPSSPGASSERFLLFTPQRLLPPRVLWMITVALLLVSAGILWHEGPRFDRTTNPLKPRNSEANATLEQIKARLNRQQEPLWVLISGRDENEIGRRLDLVEPFLARAVSNQFIAGFTLPTALWPRPAAQAANRAQAAMLAADAESLQKEMTNAGFTTNAWFMSGNILGHWKSIADSTNVFWPTNRSSRWVLGKVAARTESGWLALGLIHPGPDAAALARFAREWPRELKAEGIILSGWELLGTTVFKTVVHELPRVVIPIAALVVISLWLAFRNLRDVALSLATLAFSGLCLWAVMDLLNWEWNILNLMALPLLLGMGVDFSIHIQLALRRHGGDLLALRRSVGRALLLAGSTTIAGFGSLAFSTNAGLASLGKVCALGITLALVTSVYLLPVWRRTFMGQPGSARVRPSRFYGAACWRLALRLARLLPEQALTNLCLLGGAIYWQLALQRRQIVTGNILPVVGNDSAVARKVTRRVFDEFARKLADLWCYEAGRPMNHRFGELTGWEHFEKARAGGRGVLLVTPHLGNWEFGAPLLAQRGVKLLVITLAEPGDGFTELRRQSRARWGIETLVIGQDPFAFVEVIKRLDAGATVALLMDRPPEASAVTVEFLGRPFRASVAAAELARASGCSLLPVYLPRTNGGYAAHILPAVDYDRRALGEREQRRQLTGQILRAFEPALRQYPSQWFHFVPLWP